MKKLLVVLLALVMVIAMATSAMAFTDTDDLSTVEQDAIYRLYALGVLNGYSDGTFGADNQITRAEFAKIACIVGGFGDVSDLMSNTPSSFTDVAVGMWYTGYVNVAASQGYVHGYTDGTFKPNAPITMAEVVTVLMRIAGYNDNLPGPWPFDYIAQAGKEDVTDDVTFVSSAAATRSAVAVMVNNLLDVDMVNYDNDISDFVDDDDEGSVLEGSFGAGVYDVMFYNDYRMPDALDGWYYSDYDEKEIELAFSKYDDEYEDYYTDVETLVMNEDCYIAGGMDLTDIGGMEADIITNDDDEVIYIKIVSTVEYSDDVEGIMFADNVKVNDDNVDSVLFYTPWFDDGAYPYFASADFDEYDGFDGFAKIFYNEDGDVYAVSDLYTYYDENEDGYMDSGEYYIYASEVVVADSYDEDDEELTTLDGHTVNLEDEDFVVLKDDEEIEAADIEQMDAVTIMYPIYGEADIVLLVTPYVEGTLTEGEDYLITVDDNDYYFDTEGFDSRLNTEGGVDGDYDDLTALGQLDDVFDAGVQLALYDNPYEVAYLISDVDASSSTVYGIVTDLTVGGLFHNVTDVTILNQDGEEVTYDLDDDDIITYYDASDSEDAPLDTDVELGSYVEVKLDEDGVITSVCLDDEDDLIIYDVDEANVHTGKMMVSGSKIKIAGTWFKITDDTLFFETVTDYGVGVTPDYPAYDSGYFDEANLISVDDILDADDIVVGRYVIAYNDGGTLERLFMVDSDISAGDEGYSFVERTYTNSSGDFVEMMDGTIAERKSGEHYNNNTFYAYDIVNGEMETAEIFCTEDYSAGYYYSASPYEDAYWVLYDGTLDLTAEPDEYDYQFEDFLAYVNDFSGDTIEFSYYDGAETHYNYYTITDDTQFYVVDEYGVVDTGDDDDIEEHALIGAISDEDGNLLYVFVLEYYIGMPT